MIEVKNVKKSYGTKENSNQVLKGVSLTIKDGGFTVIFGPSGSGKSTLLNVISGLEYPDSGSICYDGNDISRLADDKLTAFRKDNVGFIFQQYCLIPGLDVDKNVKMGADLVRNKEYRQSIAAVGLSDKLHKYPSELSGGEQQRVCVARALAKKPKVLFLDEPTGALDEETGRLVLNYISRLQGELDFTVIMVTHNENIADMADMVIRMNSGKIVNIKEVKMRKTAYEIGW